MGKRGFTLVEIILVGGVLSVVIGGMMLVLAETGRNVWARTDAQLTSLTDAQRALGRVSEDLRRAVSSSLSDTGPNSCRANTLSFLESGTIRRITYTRDNSNALTRQVDANPALTVASGLTAFTPACPGGGLVRLTLTARANSLRGPSTQELESAIWVRNP